MSTEFYWVAVALVSVLSAARITRLLTFDKFPPAIWLRTRWVGLVVKTKADPEYTRLFFCGYCMSFWTMAWVVAMADLSGVLNGDPLADWMTPAWWIINGVFGGSYLSAVFMAHDGDDSEEDD